MSFRELDAIQKHIRTQERFEQIFGQPLNKLIKGQLFRDNIVGQGFIERDLREKIAQINNPFGASLIGQELTNKINQTYLNQFRKLTDAILAERFEFQFPALAEHVLRPYEYFSDYLTDTIQRLNKAQSEREKVVLQGALGLAKSEFSENLLLTESLIDEEITIIESTPLVAYNLYEEQEKEIAFLINKHSVKIKSGSFRWDSIKTKEISELAREVLKLVVKCNQASRVKGGEDIFKLTNAMFEASADLPFIIVKDDDTLATLIRHLYRVIYEGAGSDKLRFLITHNGWFEQDECDAIWTLKTLRNKLLLHDPEHGKESDIKKNYALLREELSKLGLSRVPIREEDFLVIQKSLLSQIKVFLTNLVMKMSN